MFPEDALFTYDEKIRSKEKTGKSIGEVIAEAKTASIEEPDTDTKIEFETPSQEEIEEETKLDPKEEMIETLRNAGIDYLALMYDNELEEKIEMLINSGKELIDLYLNPTVLVKYNKDQLKNRMSEIKNNGLDLKEVPLMAY